MGSWSQCIRKNGRSLCLNQKVGQAPACPRVGETSGGIESLARAAAGRRDACPALARFRFKTPMQIAQWTRLPQNSFLETRHQPASPSSAYEQNPKESCQSQAAQHRHPPRFDEHVIRFLKVHIIGPRLRNRVSGNDRTCGGTKTVRGHFRLRISAAMTPWITSSPAGIRSGYFGFSARR